MSDLSSYGSHRSYGRKDEHGCYKCGYNQCKCEKIKYRTKVVCKDGKRGPRGPQGERGPRGRDGNDGVKGEKGEKGEKGDSFIGPIGHIGPIGPTGPTGPQGFTGDTGPAGDGITSIKCNDGTGTINGEFSMLGTCGIITECKDNEVRIVLGPQGKLSEFLTDADGIEGCVFTVFCDAVKAAIDKLNNNYDAVNILVVPSSKVYKLCDIILPNDPRKILTIEGVGGGDNSVLFSGSGRISGNVYWTGITFESNTYDNSTYFADNEQSHRPDTSSFCKCTFTENFRIETKNDILYFRDSFFNYNQLTRNQIIRSEGSQGVITCCDCKFYICRFSSSEDVISFFWLNQASSQTSSLYQNCHFEMIIDGEIPFVLFFIRNIQLIRLYFITISWILARPPQTIVFGANDIIRNVQLEIFDMTNSFSAGASASITTVTIFANLWTRTTASFIKVTGCRFEAAYLIRNFLQAPDDEIPGNIMSAWVFSRVDFISTAPTPAIVLNVGGNSENQFIFKECTFDINIPGTSVINTSQSPIFSMLTGGSNDKMTMYITNVTFINYNLQAMMPALQPTWLCTDLDTFYLFYNDLARQLIDVANIKAGTFTPTALMLGPC